MPTFLDRLINSGMYNGSADSTLSQAERDGLVPDQYYLANYKNADRFKPRNTPVRQKFNGYVNFTFNSEVDIANAIGSNAEFNNTLSSLVKAADFPSAEFSTDVKNQYNRKRITVNGVQFKPITITAYDTVDSLWVIMLMKMYAHLFQDPLNKYKDNNPEKIPYDVIPEAVASGSADESAGGGFNRPFDSNRAGLNLLPGKQRNFITSMDVVQIHGQKATKFTLFNPMITNFEIESIDHADSAVSQISISVDYENFTMNPNVNAYISEDEMKRYSDFNKGEWNLKQNGNPEQANTPGGYQDHKETLSTTERKLSFLNGDGSTDIGRKQQVQFLDSFSNNE